MDKAIAIVERTLRRKRMILQDEVDNFKLQDPLYTNFEKVIKLQTEIGVLEYIYSELIIIKKQEG